MITAKDNKKYYKFHGRPAARKIKTMFNVPEKLFFLGRVKEIVYASNKYHGGGDGKKTEYIHKFTTPVDLFSDEKGNMQLYLMGEKLKVTKNGIEG